MAKVTEVAITASRTDDGAPVYLTASGGWSRQLLDAQVFPDEAAAGDALAGACAQERSVCDPYTMKVDAVNGPTRPVTVRERIRAEGPTTRLRRPDPVATA